MTSTRKWIAAVMGGLLLIGVAVQAEDDNYMQMPGATDMTYAMKKSMDPNTWTQMMTMMMDPKNSSAMASCAACHDGETVARYQKDFGPMMDSMWNMYKQSADPHMMANMMNPMMGMMNPAMMNSMMNPMMAMMNPAMMTSMMGPMMGMMNPAMMMNPMMMMGPMMGMMGPMSGMMGPMSGMMNPMGMMNPSMMGSNMMNPMGMMNPGAMMGGNAGTNQMGQMMDPKQYEQWFNGMNEMMKNFVPQTQQEAQ